jgi:hypothetical protein
MPQLVETRMILIAGGDVTAVEEVALPILHAGHIPVVGEWVAGPLVALAGQLPIGDDAFDEIFHPLAERLLTRCDAILRVGGPSRRADAVVGFGRSRGIRVFFSLKEALDG